MKRTIYKSDFVDAFDRMGRGNNFSYEGREALYDYLMMFEEDCDIEMELDVIAICCDFFEYEDLEEYNKDYGEEFETIDDISGKTSVVDIDGTRFIIQRY